MARLTQWRIPLLLAGFALAAPAMAQDTPEEPAQSRSGGKPGRIEITPYIEAAQVLSAELSPGSDSVTYTRLAAGVDASINGRNTSGGVSLRYERHFGWGKNASDGDMLSGLARVSASVVPRSLTVEAGGLAARTRIEGNGGSVIGAPGGGNGVSNMYSVYAGPSLNTHVGDVAVAANYRIGYSRVDAPDTVVVSSGGDPVDVFDDSVVQSANVHMGTKPGDVLPVGIGVGAGWNREDVSNLDQRIDDKHVRADVTVPVSNNIALVGGVGYEKVRISHRDVLRDGSGDPVIGSDGRYKTDKSSPRQIAYDVDGMIWDAGVIWRPSPRTSLEAHVGKRYGSTSYYGNFGWQATRRSSVNVSVYDSVAGFGGQLNRAVVGLPTDFQAVRNPVTGDITGCVGSLEDGNCIAGALGSVRSATFRARGISASYALNIGRISAGVGAGYDRRKYIGAEGTILESINGVTDENVWLAAYLSGRLGERASFSTNVYANWFDSGFDSAGGGNVIGASAAYNHELLRRLTATAAVGIDGVSREGEEDVWTASALVGMRYSF